jgi:RNA polymerase sigma factor (sigma-70 family)
MPPPADGFAARFVLGPALRAQPDRRLVSLVRDGYETAFEEIVRRYGKPLTRYAAAIVGTRGEDVTQDAFSKALLALRRDGNEVELRPWLFRIVRNTALNDLRDNPPSPEMLAEAIAGGSNPAEEAERREELADLIRRLRSLPEPQRAAIVMREMEGLSHEEIAAALGVSGGAARQAIHRARQALRNGAGMLVPLPLLQALLAGGTSGTAELAAGAGGVAGAGVAFKAAAATVLVAGAVAGGVAIDEGRHDGRGQQPAAVKSGPAGTAAAGAAFTAPPATDAKSGDRRGHGESEPGDDHGGRGDESGNDHGGRRGQSGDDHPGGDVEDVSDDHRGGGGGPDDDRGERSGPSGNRGGGPGPSGKESGEGGGDGQRSGSQGETSHHGGGPGPSGGSSQVGGSGSGVASSGETGSSGGSGSGGSGGSQEPPAVDESGGGPGPSGGSGGGSESGSGGGGDDSGGD